MKGGLARYGMLRGKTGKTFLVQFARSNGAIIFCRTFKNYFGQFVRIEKKVTIIVAFHFMKRRLKIRERLISTIACSKFALTKVFNIYLYSQTWIKETQRAVRKEFLLSVVLLT